MHFVLVLELLEGNGHLPAVRSACIATFFVSACISDDFQAIARPRTAAPELLQSEATQDKQCDPLQLPSECVLTSI